MKLRTVLVSVLCLILALGMAACTSTPAATTTTAAAETTTAAAETTRTKLVWGTNAAFIPFEMRENDKVVGVDADLAKAVADKMGVAIEFVEIDWDNKVFELDGKSIDVVWNGMTLTDAVLEAMECSAAYCNNAQVVVTK